jgi:L,D-peptidoglycan transpeptidase YkuD (ErfK/YbiS/YcfS/YnhG family)
VLNASQWRENEDSEIVDLLTFAKKQIKLSEMKVLPLLFLLLGISAFAMDPTWKKIDPQMPRAEQLIWVEPTSTFKSFLKLYEKHSGRWQAVRLPSLPEEVPVVIGRNSFAPRGKKVEGDKKSPQGLYVFGPFFGKAPQNFPHWHYIPTTDQDKWIDDSHHPDYNRWVRGATTAKSFESLRRADGLYDLAAVISYNMNPIVPGAGSAIFMHIWKSSNEGTAGCIALRKVDLENILHWLSDRKNPHILLGDVN